MEKLKIMMEHRNYMCIGNRHIFINFNRDNLNYVNQLNPDSLHVIHIFITNHASVNENLRFLIQRVTCLTRDTGSIIYSKVILHLPYQLKDLQTLIENFLGTNLRYKLLISRKGIMFRLHTQVCNYWLNITYGKKSLKISTVGSRTSCPVKIEFMKYPYGAVEKDHGIFETAEMRLDPERFRDKLIEGFKESCPEGILKSFKNDDEIWEYVMNQGEWSIKEGKEKIK